MSARAVFLALASLLLPACRRDMQDQPRFRPMRPTSFFEDGRSSRPLVPGTVARGRLEEDDHLHRGTVDGEFAQEFPFPVAADVLARGRERYDIFCAPCHGRTGDGDGAVVERGMRRPLPLHDARLRKAAPGYHFDVITRGFGAMFDMADRIPAEDRWAIVAYVRALQRSRNATLADVPPSERERLERYP